MGSVVTPPVVPVVNGVKPIFPPSGGNGKMAAFRGQDVDVVAVVNDVVEEKPLVILEEVKRVKRIEERKQGNNHKFNKQRPVPPKNNSINPKTDVKIKCDKNENNSIMALLDSPPPPVTKTPPPVPVRRSNGQSPVAPPLVETTPPATPPAPTGQQDSSGLTKEELRSIKLRNNNARQLIYKEVKRPGKKHEKLWEMLAQLHGPPWVRKHFILEVRQEALRFKRRDLADQLQSRCEKLSKTGEIS